MKNTKDPGLGSKFIKPVKRMVNEDGSYNIIRKGGVSGVKDFYKFLIDLHWFWFSLFLIGSFLFLNLIFTTCYVLIGIETIAGNYPELSPFENAFFFSAQTFTTVGYGALHPKGALTNYIAMAESFLGLLSFAIATGLLWGRFSKPSLKIAFSKNIIITPHEDSKAVMFKMVNQRKNVLLNTTIKCIFIIDKGSGQTAFNKDYSELKLESDQVNFFPLTWTLVHKITEDSPLYNINFNELVKRNGEVIILVETFDETFSQTILQKHSYACEQWLENVKFERNFEANEQGHIELNVQDINRYSSIN
jgi:inward rectifier potassium channel